MDKEWKPIRQEKQERAEKIERKVEKIENTRPIHHQNTEESPVNPKHWFMMGGAAIIIILIIVFFIPAFKGYSVYQAMKAAGVPATYTDDMVGLQNSKTAAEAEAVSLRTQLTAQQNQTANCQNDLRTCNAEKTSEKQKADAAIASLQTDLDATQKQLKAVITDSVSKDAAIADAARKLCCVKRFDDPTINSYEILNDKISCGKDLEKTISC